MTYAIQPKGYVYVVNEYEEVQVTADEVIVEDGSRDPKWTGLVTETGDRIMRMPNKMGFSCG